MNSNKFKEEGSIVYFSEVFMIYCLSFPLVITCANALMKTNNIFLHILDLKHQTEKICFFIPTANKGKSLKFKVAACFLIHLMLT